MTWIVTYRGGNGATTKFEVEAENRAAVFAHCRDHGISPLIVSQGSTGNGRSVKTSRRIAYIVGGVAACLLITVLICALTGKEDVSIPDSVKAPSRRVEHPAKVPTVRNTNSVVHIQRRTEPEPKIMEKQRRTINGKIIDIPKNPFGTPIPEDLEYKPIWEYTPEDYARVDPGYAARHERHLEAQRRNPWKTPADRDLAMLLFAKNGNTGLLIPFDARFKDKFLKSLETPIIIHDDDLPELKEQKRQLIETKTYLKQEIDEGRDIVAVLNEEYNRSRKISALRDNLQKELREVQKTARSEQEVEEYIQAANIMLEKEGGGKIGLPMALTRYRLKREQQHTSK